jgi:hypothetical protein
MFERQLRLITKSSYSSTTPATIAIAKLSESIYFGYSYSYLVPVTIIKDTSVKQKDVTMSA